jgi:hypothetical protein
MPKGFKLLKVSKEHISYIEESIFGNFLTRETFKMFDLKFYQG